MVWGMMGGTISNLHRSQDLNSDSPRGVGTHGPPRVTGQRSGLRGRPHFPPGKDRK